MNFRKENYINKNTTLILDFFRKRGRRFQLLSWDAFGIGPNNGFSSHQVCLSLK